ncbi:DddA-like double-stranded DNA deaminase toxin [Saccharopolyspora hirsuta]|uniref:DddA-like double-stranded DNA deaminase toxin n=1 Tax=Saccharopolyspora hirsuta TaxID=1837 RepID=UPI00331936C9
MSRLEDLAARLAAILAALPTEQLTHARDILNRAVDRVGTASTNSNDELLRKAQKRLRNAAEHADQAADELRTTAEHLTAYLTDPIGISATDTTSWKAPSYQPSMNVPARPAPLHRRHLDALPQRPNRRSPTTGILTTSDGAEINTVQSGRHGPGTGGPGLTGRWQRMAASTDHAEGHAAALLRERGIAAATLYINNRPCPGELGCDATLPAQLPPGTRLTVYWPGGYQVYEGTGEGIQR